MEEIKYNIWQRILPPAILSIITIIFYYPTLWYCFIFDDFPTITKNIHIIRSSETLSSLFFTSNRWISRFISKIIYSHWHENPLPFRIFTLSLHISIGILIYFFLLKALSNLKTDNFIKNNAYYLSILTSGLFLLHPVQTQTATYITQMELEGLVVFFTFTTLLTFIYAATANSLFKKIFLYSLSFISTMLAAGTKEIIIVLPILILLVDWFFISQADINIFKSKKIIFITFFIILFGTLRYFNWTPTAFIPTKDTALTNNRGNILTAGPDEPIKSMPFFISQFKIILHYITMFFWPLNICFDYEYKLSKSFWDFDTVFPFLLLLLILAIGLLLFIKNKTNIFTFCIAWFFISILPRASIYPSTELVCDYKTFLASFGIILLISIFIIYLIKKIIPSIVAYFKISSQKAVSFNLLLIFIFIILSGFASKQRNTVWSDELLFWQDVVIKNPTKARGYNNYAVCLSERGLKEEAIAAYKKSASLDQYYAEPIINLAFQYQAKGMNDIAMQYYSKAINMNEAHPEMYLNLGLLHMDNNADNPAKICFEIAIKLRPYYSKAFYGLARLYHKQNNLEKAAEYYKKAAAGDCEHIEYYYMHGAINNSMQKYDQAIESLEKTYQLNKNYRDTVFLLACCYYSNRNYLKASEKFEELYTKEPENKALAYNYAQSLLNCNKFQEAIPVFQKCKQDFENYPYAALHIAKCLVQIGQIKDAKKEALTLMKISKIKNIQNDCASFLKEIS